MNYDLTLPIGKHCITINPSWNEKKTPDLKNLLSIL